MLCMFAWECVPKLKALWLARLVGKVCGDTIPNCSVALALTHCHSTCSVIFFPYMGKWERWHPRMLLHANMLCGGAQCSFIRSVLCICYLHDNISIHKTYTHIHTHARACVYKIINVHTYNVMVAFTWHMISLPLCLSVCLSVSLSPISSPFFGSDRCSMVSLPTSAKVEKKTEHKFTIHRSHWAVHYYCLFFPFFSFQSAEAMGYGRRSPLPPSQTQEPVGGSGSGSGFSNISKKYGSLERAIHTERMDSPILVCLSH